MFALQPVQPGGHPRLQRHRRRQLPPPPPIRADVASASWQSLEILLQCATRHSCLRSAASQNFRMSAAQTLISLPAGLDGLVRPRSGARPAAGLQSAVAASVMHKTTNRGPLMTVALRTVRSAWYACSTRAGKICHGLIVLTCLSNACTCRDVLNNKQPSPDRKSAIGRLLRIGVLARDAHPCLLTVRAQPGPRNTEKNSC